MEKMCKRSFGLAISGKDSPFWEVRYAFTSSSLRVEVDVGKVPLVSM